MRVCVRKKTRASLPDYRLEVIDSYLRHVFDGMKPGLNELMWELLPPFPAASATCSRRSKGSREGVRGVGVREPGGEHHLHAGDAYGRG